MHSNDESEGMDLSSSVVFGDVVWMGVGLKGVLSVRNVLACQSC